MNSFAARQPSLTFSDIPVSYLQAGYSVVVYYGSTANPSTSTLSITGSGNDRASRSIITGNAASSGYRAVGFVEETGSLSGPTNFSVFKGLDDPGFTAALTGDNSNGIAAIQIVKAMAPSFTHWQRSTPGAGQRVDSDGDHDGWVDFAEYALGSDPARAGRPANAPILLKTPDGQDFVYRRPRTLADVTYQLEGSTDLANWYPITDIVPQITSDATTNQVRYLNVRSTANVPGMATSVHCFYRLALNLK